MSIDEVSTADKTFGMLIKEARKENRLTQEALANKIGKTESLIRKYEKGLLKPSKTLIDLANALNKPVSYFYSAYDKTEEVQKQHENKLTVAIKEMSTEEIRQLIIDATNELISRI